MPTFSKHYLNFSFLSDSLIAIRENHPVDLSHRSTHHIHFLYQQKKKVLEGGEKNTHRPTHIRTNGEFVYNICKRLLPSLARSRWLDGEWVFLRDGIIPAGANMNARHRDTLTFGQRPAQKFVGIIQNVRIERPKCLHLRFRWRESRPIPICYMYIYYICSMLQHGPTRCGSDASCLCLPPPPPPLLPLAISKYFMFYNRAIFYENARKGWNMMDYTHRPFSTPVSHVIYGYFCYGINVCV